jgi:hypothetical protein
MAVVRCDQLHSPCGTPGAAGSSAALQYCALDAAKVGKLICCMQNDHCLSRRSDKALSEGSSPEAIPPSASATTSSRLLHVDGAVADARASWLVAGRSQRPGDPKAQLSATVSCFPAPQARTAASQGILATTGRTQQQAEQQKPSGQHASCCPSASASHRMIGLVSQRRYAGGTASSPAKPIAVVWVGGQRFARGTLLRTLRS